MKKLVLMMVVAAIGGAFAQEAMINNRPRNGVTPPANPSRPAAVSDESQADVGGRDIEFNGATLDMVFKFYEDLVGKTVLRDPQVPNDLSITIQPKKRQVLTSEDKILAIETVLEMNGIHLEPYGEKFIRAVPRANARKDGIPLIMNPEAELNENSMRVISLMLTFRNIAFGEAQKALEGLKSDKGVLNPYERTNSILVTDTEMNIVRMREIAKAIDVQLPPGDAEESDMFVRQIKNTSADTIKSAIDELVKFSEEWEKELKDEQEKRDKQANQAQQSRTQPFMPGRNLLNRNQPQSPQPTANESLVTSVVDASRGMIRGKVLVVADPWSNKLIIFSHKLNMKYFDPMIEQLDVKTTPDTVVRVYRLKYADAEEVSDMINDLLGNAPSSKNSSKGSQNANSKTSGSSNMTTQTKTKSVNQRAGEASTGELSKENTTVLADKRINGLVVMTNKELVSVLEEIIKAMDIKLSQVLIETCIIEVNLEDTIKTGIDWVHQIMDKNIDSAVSGGGGSTTLFKGLSDVAANGALASGIPVGSGLNYYIFNDKLNIGAMIEASKSDSRSKYLASPVIMTVDNKEATIEATQMRYLLTGFTSSGTSYSTIAVPNYEQKQIGITIKTTPKINPNGTVMLTIEEEYSQLGAPQQIQTSGGLSGNSDTETVLGGGSNKEKGGLITVDVDTTVTRKMSADISLENRQTVILGGLTETKTSKVDTGIPILKDIPLIGRYLFGKTEDQETRKELLVFMTPYVLEDAASAQAEALRRKQVLSEMNAWNDRGWSQSKLADPVDASERLRRQREIWEQQDKEYETQLELDEARKDRAEELNDRAKEISTRRAEEAKALADELNAVEEQKAEARAEAELKVREENADLLDELKEESSK